LIIRRRLALACAILALAGCEPSGGGFSFLSGPSGAMNTQIEMFDGAVIVATPAGYCIDRNATRAEAGFAVEASCALVARGGTAPRYDGLITVQIGDPASAIVTGEERELRAFLKSDQGKQLLAGDGPPRGISVGKTGVWGHVVEVYLNSAPRGGFDGFQPVEWRAFFDLKDRLVTIRLRGYDRAPLSYEQGQALLRTAIDAMIQANSVVATAETG
jgi:hypothetical protein